MCAKEYASSLANPFGDGPDGACIPDAPALMTRRLKVWNKGTFTTSTAAASTGVGFIGINPGAGIANDANCVTVNDPAGLAPNFDFTTAGNFVPRFSNSDYVTADIAPDDITYRTVSAGVRIRNVSPEIDRGGVVVGLHEPEHVCLHGMDIAFVDGYQESGRIAKSTDEWTVLTYRPVETDDLDWSGALAPGPGAGVFNSYFMGFIVQAPSLARVQIYEYEAYFNYEAQGQRAIGKAPSHADPTGYAAVNAMTVFARNLHSPHQEEPIKMADSFVKGVSHYVDHHMTRQSPPGQTKEKPSVWSSIIGALPSIASTVLSLL